MPLKVKACIEALADFFSKSEGDCAYYLK